MSTVTDFLSRLAAGGTRPDSIRTLDPQDSPSISVVGDTYRIVASGKQTDKEFAVIDMLVPPGGGPGPHAHANIQETFFVVEGEVVVRSETQKYVARKGSFVEIPTGGAVHSFRNESDQVAHLLCVVVPAGLDKFFQKIGKPVNFGQFLPRQEPTPEQQEQMKKVAEEYGQELFPPDYLDKQK